LLSRSIESCEAMDVVHLAGACLRPAPFTALGEAALSHCASPAGPVCGVVKDTGVFVPRQGDAAEQRSQRLCARASGLLDPQGLEGLAAVLDQLGPATAARADLRLLLGGQWAEQGGVPHAIHAPQAVGMQCQQRGWDTAPVCCRIWLDDAAVVIDQPFRPGYGLARPQVRSASCHHDVLGALEPNSAVPTALPTTIMCVIRRERHHLAAKEASGPGPGLRDPRLCSRQFPSQFVAKKRAAPPRDLLGLRSRSAAAQQRVVRVADVLQPPAVRIVGGT
jgi:hypothetical protein